MLDTEVSEDFEEPIFHPNIMEEMLSKYKIDAIFVCSPTDYHYSCVKKALNLQYRLKKVLQNHWFYRPSNRKCEYNIGFIDPATEKMNITLVL